MTESNAPTDLDHVVAVSLHFYDALAEILGESVGTTTHRSMLALGTASTALEHGIAILSTVQGGQLASASVLLRAQFEAVTRALWLHYCAEDRWIEDYFATLRDNPARDPSDKIKMNQMLNDLSASAPPPVAAMLQPLKQAAWGPLNSYVHSGIHAVIHQHVDPTENFADSTLRNGNGLAGMAAMLIAVSSGESDLARAVAEIQLDHLDCLPPLNPPPTSSPAPPAPAPAQ